MKQEAKRALDSSSCQLSRFPLAQTVASRKRRIICNFEDLMTIDYELQVSDLSSIAHCTKIRSYLS